MVDCNVNVRRPGAFGSPYTEITQMSRRENIYPPVRGLGAWLQLVRAYNYMESEISIDLRADDLSLARVHVMVALDLHGPMSQQALADHLFVTKGNIVGLIN